MCGWVLCVCALTFEWANLLILQVPSDSVEKALAVLNANKCPRLCGDSEKLSSYGRPHSVITSGSLR